MNVEAADFQARICTPSPAPYFQSMASFGIPTHPAQFKADTQYAQFPPASSSFESYDSLGSFYSKPHTSIESAGSRAVSNTFSIYVNQVNILHRVGLLRI